MFTYDQKFQSTKLNTSRRTNIHQELVNALKLYNVDINQIVCLDGSGKKYVAETSSILFEFFKRVSLPENCIIFSDKGYAFLHNKESVLLQCGVSKTATYPPPVHHFISPNDNNYHGEAKTKWRNMINCSNWDSKDGVLSSVFLMSCLNDVSMSHIQSFFKRNFFLESSNPSIEDFKNLVTAGNFEKIEENEYFSDCHDSYQFGEKMDLWKKEGDHREIIALLDSGLDGSYWNKY